MTTYTVLVLCQIFIAKLSLIEWRNLPWHINISALYNVPLLYRRLNTAIISMLHFALLFVKNLSFSVFTTMETYSCEKTVFMCDRCLYSEISSVNVFTPHINIQNCYTQCTLTGCEENGNIAVTVLRLLQCAVHTVAQTLQWGNWVHLKCGLKLEIHHQILTNET